jgi:SAM-dependent methyltransferase
MTEPPGPPGRPAPSDQPDPVDPVEAVDAVDPWSAVATGWARAWGSFVRPVWDPLLAAAGVRPGDRVLDVGCGTGELLARLAALGARPAGVDPAPGMVEIARRRAPDADVRCAPFEELPFPDGAFDVVTAVNALQLADPDEALDEAARVLVPGGVLALAGWAERERNDVDAVERAVAAALEDDPPTDGPLRLPGGLEAALASAGFDVVGAGLAPVPWTAPDDDALVAGILLGEEEPVLAGLRAAVVDAARPFRTPDGGYRLVNAFRWAVGRTPA